jgi:3-oxoacyl-[acyl-carrier protein] reductase
MAVDYELQGKTAIVCGASTGMGKASALGLAQQGVHVLLVSRSQEKLDAAKAEIEGAADTNVITLAGDVSAAATAQQAVEMALGAWGHIDILVNNTGGPPPGSFLEKSDSDWDAALDLNLKSAIRFSTAAAPHMIKQSWGRIINITSTLAKEPTSPMVLSATSRAAVSAYSKSISSELAPHGVTVNTLCPGGVLTDRLHSLLESAAESQSKSYQEVLENSQALIPIGRFADPEEFADALVFFASERARYLTGVTLMVDGGLTKGVF